MPHFPSGHALVQRAKSTVTKSKVFVTVILDAMCSPIYALSSTAGIPVKGLRGRMVIVKNL